MNKFWSILAIIFVIACVIVYLAWHLVPIIIASAVLIVAYFILKNMFKKNKNENQIK
jgi:ABC-type bacteriocin/lantibiotic exporter with double-glycine peptidase domain